MIVNPEFEAAELEMEYVWHPSVPPECRPKYPIRFRAKDIDEIHRRSKAGEPLGDLMVPSHIMVP